MPTARKLPSGNWRVRAYVGEGKNKKTVSFTAATKSEAERKASEFLAENHRSRVLSEITVKEAIRRYIAAKEGVLSPSTVREYKGLQRLYYETIEHMKIYRLTTEDMQTFISYLVVSKDLSPKTIANIYGLLSSAVAMFRPDAVFRVTLPSRKKPRAAAPSDDHVQRIFQEAREELRLCIALAAFGSLRRGEICALKHADVTGCVVHVHADIVLDENNEFVYKPFPKTSDSIRSVLLPPEVIDMIGDGVDDEFILDLTPTQVSSRFRRLRQRLGLSVRFHDLRHYYASIGAVLGIPDAYLAEFGGWRSDSPVMKNVYQNTIDVATDAYAKTLQRHFSGLICG